jgi:hypothetical protein
MAKPAPVMTVEVSSWYQVPRIIEQLQSGAKNGRQFDMRLCFHPPTNPADPQGQSILQSQNEIREFFQTLSNASSVDLYQALNAKLTEVSKREAVPFGMSVDDWLKGHKRLSRGSKTVLIVTDIVEFKDTTGNPVQAIQLGLQSANADISKRMVAFVVEPQSASSDLLAQALKDGALKSVAESQQASIWLGELVWQSGPQAFNGAPLRELSVADFIKLEEAAAAAKKKKAQAQQQQQQGGTPQAGNSPAIGQAAPGAGGANPSPGQNAPAAAAGGSLGREGEIAISSKPRQSIFGRAWGAAVRLLN